MFHFTFQLDFLVTFCKNWLKTLVFHLWVMQFKLLPFTMLGAVTLNFFRVGRHLFMVVLSVRYKFYTKTSEKREVSQDLQNCSLLMAIKHHCYTEFTVLLNLTVIIIMLPKAWFLYDCYDRCNH